MKEFEKTAMKMPPRIRAGLLSLGEGIKREVCEIRIRKDLPLSVSTYNAIYFVSPDGSVSQKSRGLSAGREEIEQIVDVLTEGSVYRHMQTISSGYIVTEEGVRAGICGEAVEKEKGKICAVANISSLCLRIPKYISHLFPGAVDILKNTNASLLVISPPSVGKTTFIRCAAAEVGRVKNVAVIDTKCEILPQSFYEFYKDSLIDRFAGYGKSEGLEIATRMFCPDLIVCDEIGLEDDTDSLLAVASGGVSLLATVHGGSLEEIMRKPNIRRLVDHRVFTHYALMQKTNGAASMTMGEFL